MILSNLELHQALDAKRLIIDPEPAPRLPAPDHPSPYDTHAEQPSWTVLSRERQNCHASAEPLRKSETGVLSLLA
jgi:hypothetical protein